MEILSSHLRRKIELIVLCCAFRLLVTVKAMWSAIGIDLSYQVRTKPKLFILF